MASSPLISIIHPTARVKPYPSFPRGWRGACEQFFATCAHPENVEYILVVHEAQWREFWREFGFRSSSEEISDVVRVFSGVPAFGSFVVVQNHRRTFPMPTGGFAGCVVDQLNEGAKSATGQLFLGIMDDLEAPERWDAEVRDLLWRHRASRDSQGLAEERVVDLTGESSQHIVYGAMTRARYEKQGYILNPEFESMYADNYFSFCAHRDGVVIDGRHLGFKHNHPINGRSERDEIYDLQNRAEAYQQGFVTFAKLVHGTRVIAVCLPGETFPYIVEANQFRMLTHLNHGDRFIVRDHRCHTTNVYMTRIELADAVLSLKPLADFVLWIDDDNFLTPEQFEMLLADLEEHPELDGVVGWCWCDNDGELDEQGNQKPWMMSCGRQTDDLLCKRFTLEDFRHAVSAGHMLVTSDDLEPDAFWSGFPVVLLRGATQARLGWEAFKPLLFPHIKRGFTSEDTSYFYNARQAGMKFAVDLRVKVPHLKIRAIEPQYIPEQEKPQAKAAQGFLSEALIASGAD